MHLHIRAILTIFEPKLSIKWSHYLIFEALNPQNVSKYIPRVKSQSHINKIETASQCTLVWVPLWPLAARRVGRQATGRVLVVPIASLLLSRREANMHCERYRGRWVYNIKCIAQCAYGSANDVGDENRADIHRHQARQLGTTTRLHQQFHFTRYSLV